MQLMQRLGNKPNDEYVNDYLTLITENPGACDNVWIPIHYGYPPMKVHREAADYWKTAAEKFKKAGVSVSVQISNSIGHGQSNSSNDFSGLNYEGSPVHHLVGPDGTVSNYCFCWRCPTLADYLLEVVSYYCELKPEIIWVDDDFRPANHSPAGFGCFCDHCIAEFNRQHNSSFTREALVAEILHGELVWRERWAAFIREGLGNLMHAIGETVHRLSPDTALALQHGNHGSYAGFGYEYLFEPMIKTTGKTPGSRPGGGAYDDHDPNEFIRKAVELSAQNAKLPPYVKIKCPEIENLPHVVYGKSPSGTAFETSLYFAIGSTDMSYSMMMYCYEPLSFYDKTFKLFAAHRSYWEKMAKYNIDSHQAGMRYYVSHNGWQRTLAANQGFAEMNSENLHGATPLLRIGYPIAWDTEEQSLILLTPDNAAVLSEEEVNMLRTKSVITDGESIAILTSRGFDFGIDARPFTGNDVTNAHEVFTDHPLNPDFLPYYNSCYFAPGRKAAYGMQLPEDAEILGYFEEKQPIKPLFENSEHPLGAAEAIIRLPEGGRWAILGYCPWKNVVPHYRREQALNIADEVGKHSLPARLATPAQVMLLPRENADGKTVCVSLVNCTVGESGELTLRIRRPVGDRFTFMSQHSGECELSAEHCGDEVHVTLPSIAAWSVATVFIE